MDRPTCAYCGAKARKDTRYTGLQREEYKGNLKVTKHIQLGTEKNKHHAYYLWDGESYRLGYDPFCKLKCAGKFAKLAYQKGYRIRA